MTARNIGSAPDPSASGLAAGAVVVLETADPPSKAVAAGELAARWRAGGLELGRAKPPDRPARPPLPRLRPPRDMPKRRATGSLANRIALLHALAHIELNAIDLAADMLARFARPDGRRAFLDDWVHVLDEEAKHFLLLSERLAALGAGYGDLPAHDGLWEAAAATAHDRLARLAVVPLVLEARGLDVTPRMIRDLDRAGDGASAAVLQTIYADEIGHVAIGQYWFRAECAQRGLEPGPAWQALVRTHFKGSLKPPFNDIARAAAGMVPEDYRGLAGMMQPRERESSEQALRPSVAGRSR
jgi:uncharacterized ferritin-like protein (DUF455 family)